ncbi:MAG: hypothetical protein LBB89_00150 [Treponema sp.]|jgi:hypothetical protein|nr:hypothetical protein [Treponema sp.]
MVKNNKGSATAPDTEFVSIKTEINEDSGIYAYVTEHSLNKGFMGYKIKTTLMSC